MAVVGDFLSLMLRETGDHKPDPIAAQNWLQQRYASVLEIAPWPFLVREATFQTVAQITAGTVTVTLGSATITETTSNANGWSSAVEGRYFRRDGDSELYLIDTFNNLNPDTLTLNRVYEGTTGTVIGYEIVQRLYSLASDVREIIDIATWRNAQPLREVSQLDLDLVYPNRAAVSYPPHSWAYAGRDTSNNTRIELYPIPDVARGIFYRYIQETPSLLDDADVTILPQVNIGLLKSGWMADYWNWRASFDNMPAQAVVKAQQFEAEFGKRLQEMMVREVSNFTPERLKLPSRFIRHRLLSKFSRLDAKLLTDD